ncbi:uncharacterized protein OCT59_003030 [Rhizophagus irregularis]|uniref:uncharacterized protein n=1 Tax=Rhizophagus irregularis TaxID=588596 RepID=UPI0033176EE3|nr:hypothetical protein OCT59_003030 [Rhizophagus irregularis]
MKKNQRKLRLFRNKLLDYFFNLIREKSSQELTEEEHNQIIGAWKWKCGVPVPIIINQF